MEEENVLNAEAESVDGSPDLGKFKSVGALRKAYEELEAEFTRRSQRLKALEQSNAPKDPEAGQPKAHSEPEGTSAESGSEALYRAVTNDEGVRARVIEDYFKSLKGVPLLMGAGRGITAPADRPKSFAEAGALALGYLKSKK